MNKDLMKLIDAANAIVIPSADEYRQGVADAKAAQAKAQQAKEDAQTEKEFDAACDQAMRAREKEAFFKRRLDGVVFTPRMDQAVYDTHLRTADAVVTGAVDKYLDVAEKAGAAIVAARKEFLSTVSDTDHALEALDAAANVLQCEYRYRVTHFQGAPDIKTEDSGEWRNHAVRYGNGEGCRLATSTDAGRVAWNAAEAMERRMT